MATQQEWSDEELKQNGNNLYVKNIPDDWTQKGLFDIFTSYGKIQSIKMEENNFGKYAYVCYSGQGLIGNYNASVAQK